MLHICYCKLHHEATIWSNSTSMRKTASCTQKAHVYQTRLSVSVLCIKENTGQEDVASDTPLWTCVAIIVPFVLAVIQKAIVWSIVKREPSVHAASEFQLSSQSKWIMSRLELMFLLEKVACSDIKLKNNFATSIKREKKQKLLFTQNGSQKTLQWRQSWTYKAHVDEVVWCVCFSYTYTCTYKPRSLISHTHTHTHTHTFLLSQVWLQSVPCPCHIWWLKLCNWLLILSRREHVSASGNSGRQPPRDTRAILWH